MSMQPTMYSGTTLQSLYISACLETGTLICIIWSYLNWLLSHWGKDKRISLLSSLSVFSNTGSYSRRDHECQWPMLTIYVSVKSKLFPIAIQYLNVHQFLLFCFLKKILKVSPVRPEIDRHFPFARFVIWILRTATFSFLYLPEDPTFAAHLYFLQEVRLRRPLSKCILSSPRDNTENLAFEAGR